MKMEVVLSGSPGDGGEPFRNEDVREWSRLDRLTGMLERARVETGRWRANTEDASQSYGKMVDSRERNSADGSLVQKARRQVEIFQSQGTGGRSFQVVRASQWSSSRATDCGFDNTLTDKPHNPESMSNGSSTTNGTTTIPQPAPRLSLWRSSNPDSDSADLERLSSLCRRLHDEAISQGRQLWALRSSAHSPSPPSSPDDTFPLRSNSNEDVSSLPPDEEAFSRESKVRRSLQISETDGEVSRTTRTPRPRNELIAERARKFEENGGDGLVNGNGEVRRNYISTKSFTPIANNDFVKNDPNHPSKHQTNGSKVSPPPATVENGHHPVPAARKANNRTVVLLRTSPENDNGHSYPDDDGATTIVNGTAKPVKKVEFCKTELHFAADSGKVNIVETDGKPPPTNKFRRRRRNHGFNAQPQKQPQPGMPLVHFGDTSYEKYIFGGQGKPPPENTKPTEDSIIASSSSSAVVAEENNKSGDNNLDKKETRERTEPQIDPDGSTMRETYESGSFRLRANHTTTVSFLNEETTPGTTNIVPIKLEPGLRNVQLQFGGRSLSPLDGDDECSVNRTTKITVRLPAEDVPEPEPASQVTTTTTTTTSSSERSSSSSSSNYSNLESYRLVKGIDENLIEEKLQDIDGANSLKELLTKLYGNKTEEGFKFRDFKKTRDKKLLEIKDALDKKRKALDKKISTAGKSSNTTSSSSFSSQVALKDLDKYTKKDTVTNPVLLKVLASHKPILARLENDRGFNSSFRSHLQKTKDDCDNKPKGLLSESLFVDRIPVYENIFDAISDGPLYENFKHGRGGKKTPEPKKKSTEPILYDKKTATTKRMGASVTRPTEASMNRAKSTSRSVTPLSTGSKSDTESKSRSTSKSRDSSVKRYNKEGKVITKEADTKRKSSLKSDTGTLKTLSSTNSETLRKKKPVEVVYQTAVYNMKNEKLSKQSANKAKETKGPRLINDLICGSKIRRPAADKKIKAAVVSQNTSKRKETSTALKR